MSLSSRLAFEFAKSAQYKGVDLLRARRIQAIQLRPVSFQRGRCKEDRSIKSAFATRTGACWSGASALLRRLRPLQASVDGNSRSRPLGAVTDAGRPAISKMRDDPDFDTSMGRRRSGRGIAGPPAGRLPCIPGRSRRVQIPPPPQIPAWQEHLAAVQSALQPKSKPAGWTRNFEILYAVNVNASRAAGAIQIDFFREAARRTGSGPPTRNFAYPRMQIEMLQDPVDADAISMMMGGQDPFSYSYYGPTTTSHKTLPRRWH